jgi:uncharacterized protein
MRYGTCLIDARSPLSLSVSEIASAPIVVPGVPCYGLVPNGKGKPRLYSARNIGRDEVISTHPIQVVPKRQLPALRRTGLEDLCFDWNDDGIAFALGAGAFIGDSSDPNCLWKADYANRSITIRPRRPIYAGEELTIDYSTHTRRVCAAVSRHDVQRLPANQLPKPEVPKAVVIIDPSFGRTLIAVKDIRKGENIGEAPVRVINPNKMGEFGRIPALIDLAHTWRSRCSALVLGIPAMVNHSYLANAFYSENPDRRTIALIAYRDIPAGAEITMNYNGHPTDKSELDWESTERDEPLVVPLIKNDRRALEQLGATGR